MNGGEDLVPSDVLPPEAVPRPSIARVDGGKFAPGVSGNPGGRPKVPAVLRDAGPEACELLVKIMRGEKADEKVTPGQAATTIIDRIYARPAPDTGGDGGDRLLMFFAGVDARMAAARAQAEADYAEDADA